VKTEDVLTVVVVLGIFFIIVSIVVISQPSDAETGFADSSDEFKIQRVPSQIGLYRLPYDPIQPHTVLGDQFGVGSDANDVGR